MESDIEMELENKARGESAHFFAFSPRAESLGQATYFFQGKHLPALNFSMLIPFQGNVGALGRRGEVGLPGEDVSCLHLRQKTRHRFY